MSTYTDLQRNIKENIAVDYCNRATPQEVHFLNANNEYWGIFNGQIVVQSSTILDSAISGATLTDSVLDGSTVILDASGAKLDIGSLPNKFEEISDMITTYDENFACIGSKLKKLSTEYFEYKDNIKTAANTALSTLSANMTDVQTIANTLSTFFSTISSI